MKFKTTMQKEQEIEIPIPCFYREPNPHNIQSLQVFAALDNDTVCTVYESEGMTLLGNYSMSLKSHDLIKAHLNWEPITEGEFMTAYKRALHSMSLTPELVIKEETGPMAD